MASMTLQSSAFAPDARIPGEFTGDGKDLSPELHWSGAPANTKELALIVDDPDAPQPPAWVHWVICKIPATATSLPTGMTTTPQPENGMIQGKNSWGTIGYRGPQPPKGKPHHYHFHLYALDTELQVSPGVTKEALLQKMGKHVIGQGELVGVYSR